LTGQNLNQMAEILVAIAVRQHSLTEDDAEQKITLRQLGPKHLSTAQPITSEEIRTLREEANLSQAAFARFLNLTTGYVSQLERGVKKPSGPALTLLNVIRRKGLEAIL